MFRTLLSRLADRFAEEIDSLLAADFDFDEGGLSDSERSAGAVRYHREHPHRTQLSHRRDRRPGGMPAAPAYCVTPVQSTSPRRRFGVLSDT